jgi:DNA modification methylase
MYVINTVTILREIRRVLRPDGVVFWNIGDCYSGSGGAGGDYNEGGLREGQPKYPGREPLKPKDLCMIPFRVALAAQADGWWVRSDIIWHKPNPMPEPANDRPARSHEYIFLFTKSKNYFWDADAIREKTGRETTPEDYARIKAMGSWPSGGKELYAGSLKNDHVPCVTHPLGRAVRSVWTIPSHAYKGAHFATFPPKLVERCIMAGSSEKGRCPTCGAPWERIIEIERPEDWEDEGPVTEHDKEQREIAKEIYGENGNQKTRSLADIYGRATLSRRETVGWKPTCECPAQAPVPCLVLDPFVGSGTTLEVAYRLGRASIGIDISDKYMDLAIARMAQIPQPVTTLEEFAEGA